VGGRRLTARAMARPQFTLLELVLNLNGNQEHVSYDMTRLQPLPEASMEIPSS
jgi:hypothetical protein